jgi:hypothetical protein
MTKQLFTPTADGTAHDIQPAGVPLILADTVYGNSQHDSTPAGRNRAENMLFAMLTAARAGGYTQTVILHTLLVFGEPSQRIRDMVRAACAAAGIDRAKAIFDDVRKGQR